MARKQQDIPDVHNHGIIINSREIFLNSHISDNDDDPGIDYRCSIGFLKNLRLLENINQNPILIHLQTPGGDTDCGLAIYDAIKTSKSHITILVHGAAHSMGSIILQAADNRVFMPSASLLIHGCHLNVSISLSAARSTVDYYEVQDNRMLDILCDKCAEGELAKVGKWSSKNIKRHLLKKISDKHDWYLNAEEAIKYGFADSIFGSTETPDIASLYV